MHVKMITENILKPKFHAKMDTCGTVISLACAVHCIVMPLLVPILPLVGLSFLLSSTIEIAFIIASICTATASLCWGYLLHKKIRALIILIAASIMIISGFFILPHDHAHDHAHDHSAFNIFLLVAGGSALACAHLMNRHLCKTCSDCQHHHSVSH